MALDLEVSAPDRDQQSLHVATSVDDASEEQLRPPPTKVRPILVSNRAPFEPFANGPVRRGSGGVVTALTALATRCSAEWVACARTQPERRDAAKARGQVGVGQGPGFIHYAEPTPDAQRMHYSVIANPILWYTQHYLWDLTREPRFDDEVRRAWRDGYVAVNATIAKTVAALVCPDPAGRWVLCHDYQLYLVPRLVREFVPNAVIQHFVGAVILLLQGNASKRTAW